MKKCLSIILIAILMLCPLTACTENNGTNTGEKSVVDKALTGVWYSAYDSAVLDIRDDGTGTIALEDIAYDAQFSAENGVFSADCEYYSFSGEYTLENETLYVYIPYASETYTAVFVRNKVVIPEELKGGHIYQIEDEAYEIVINDEKIFCKGLPFPPTEEYFETEVIFIPEDGQEGNTSGENNEPASYKVHVTPPPEIFKKSETGNTEETNTLSDTSPTATENTEADNTENKASDSENEDSATSYIPDTVSVNDGKVTVTKDGETLPTTKGGGSIVGTWTSDKQDGKAYIFGYTSDLSYTVTYTFNADGTGTVTALFFTGTVNWSMTGNRLDLTVSMLGDTDSGSAYVTIMGDVMYFVNEKGDLYSMSKTA